MRFLVVTGPTASGKSALALSLARAFDGVVINADSMQIYRELPILSAAPSPEEQAQAPHRLYGALSVTEPCSAGRWREMAVAEIAAARVQGKQPILVGGTGLYLGALLRGLSPLPEIPPEIRAEARALLAAIGPAALHGRLAAVDPQSAQRLRPSDSQRLARAWEVWQATGRPITAWQALPPEGALAEPVLPIILDPPRDVLYPAINVRFLAMLAAGALDEVATTADLPEALPAMRALGIPDLRRALAGTLAMDQAVAAAQAATRQYAKRQSTWMRHQLPGCPLRLSAQFSESLWPKIFPIIRQFLLTGVS